MYDIEFIDELLSDKSLGAGNFLTKLQKISPNPEGVVIQLDESVKLPSGQTTNSLSIKQLQDWSLSVAAWYEQVGIEQKDPVGLYLEDSIAYFIHFLALTYIGAIPVLVNGNLSAEIAVQFFKRVNTTIVISHGEKIKNLKVTASELNLDYDILNLDDINFTPKTPKYSHRHHDSDPVLLAHTSGTTGIPKAVQFNHHGFFFGVGQQLKKQFGERVMSALPHSHSSAISIVMSTLLRGALLKIQTQKLPLEVFASITEFQADMFISFPKILVDMCRHDLNEYDLSTISYWLSTGDANHEPHIRKLIAQGSYKYKDKQVSGSIFIDNLGSSEFGFAAFRNLHFPGSNSYNRKIGLPFEWVEAAILDEYGNKKEPGETGYLGVKSPSVTAGYWNNTYLTEKNRLHGYWLTGDLAYQNENGVFYHVDRIPDVICTEQGNLYSCQTEELILKNFPEVFDCSIFAIKAQNNKQKAVVSLEIVNLDIGEEDMLNRLNTMLIKNNTPEIHSVVFESSDRNLGATGKKLKRVLRNNFEAA